MKIQIANDTKFKGYDARTLRGFLMSSNCQNIAQEMSSIGKREGFKIYTVSNGKFLEGVPNYSENTIGLWAQDLWMIVKNKLLALDYDRKFYTIKNALCLNFDFTEKICHETDTIKQLNQNIWDIFDELGGARRKAGRTIADVTKEFESKKLQLLNQQKDAHIPGGNIFIVKGDNGDEIIIGKKELEKFSKDEILSMYSCRRMTILPQMDYHLDLFIRPLDKKRILVADDSKTLEILNSGLSKLYNYIAQLPLNEKKEYEKVYSKFYDKVVQFENSVAKNNRPNADIISERLSKAGFVPIRVPGRFYDIENDVDNEQFIKHYCNYINANVIKNRKEEIIYITNKSNIDSVLGLTPEISRKIGFSFEKSFIYSILRYISPSKIYFIKGDNNFVANEMLSIYQGGIHCTCAEIPKGVNIKLNKGIKKGW